MAMRRVVRMGLVLGLAVALFLSVVPTANADTTYGCSWKYSAKGEGVKVKDRDFEVTTFRDNGTFASGPIQNGTWGKNAKGKFTASISQADVQRIVDQLGGAGITVTSIRQVVYKLKEDDKGPHKTGKLKFSMKMRVHVNIPSEGLFDVHLDIKVKFSGRELP